MKTTTIKSALSIVAMLMFFNLAQAQQLKVICETQVTREPIPAQVVTQPVNTSVYEGEAATFIISAIGDDTIVYQWQNFDGFVWNNMSEGLYSGTDNDTLVILNALIGFNGFQYRCIVNNSCGIDTSDAANLNVNLAAIAGLSGNFCPDQTFGTNGEVIHHYNDIYNYYFKTLVQPNGKIVSAGSTQAFSDDFNVLLARHNADGTPDLSFNATGFATFDAGFSDNDEAYSLALYPGDKYVIAGRADNGAGQDVLIMRFNNDGTLDNTFNGNGIFLTDVLLEDDLVYDIAVQSNGKILVCGNSVTSSEQHLLVIRVNADGSLDSSFDSDGILTIPNATYDNKLKAIALTSTEQIVVAGYLSDGSCYVARLNNDGSFDTNFNGTGYNINHFSTYADGFNDLAIVNDTIYAAGYYSEYTAEPTNNSQFLLARFATDGSLDINFNALGYNVADLGALSDVANAITIQSDNKILLGGLNWTDVSTFKTNFGLARFTPNGNIDITFNEIGILTAPLSSDSAQCVSIALMPDNTIIAAGAMFFNGNYDATLVKYEVCPCIVNIPDANFKVALVGNSLINTNADGEIQCSEASAYSDTLDINSLNISDLTGIEAFTSITNLYCFNNQLTYLDLSSNTALVELKCYDNLLTTLDLSANTALTYVDCFSNLLTNLNISNNLSLNSLICSINQLTNINTSANTSLSGLACDNNQLTSLDLSNNTNLSSLDCSYNNQLSSVDVSNNSALIYLDCSYSNLLSLNVKNGNNINFSWFDATYNSLLSCIQVDDTTWANANWTVANGNIDATANYSVDCVAECIVNIPDANFKTALVGNPAINTNTDGEIQCLEATAYSGTIDVNSLSISDLTGIEAFTSLNALYCWNNQLTSIDVSANTALTILNCYTNQLSSIDLSSNTALFGFNCYNNQFTSLDISANTGLSELSCNGNLLTSLDVSSNTALTYLDCSNNQLTNLDFSTNTVLAILECFNNQLTSLNLSANTALTILECSDNQLTSLNVKNGNNINFTDFFANNNPLLGCIQVDNATWSNANWINIDASASFSEDCSAIIVSSTITNATCFGSSDGSIDITVTGGTAPYTYAWSNLSGLEDLTGLAAGEYIVTVTDALSANLVDTFTVTEPAQLFAVTAVQTNESCYGANDGSVDGSGMGGVSPYTFAWSTLETTPLIGGLAGGSYDLTVTDANGCTALTTFSIFGATQITLSPSSVDATCGNYDGSATVIPSGGTTPYTYSWSDAQTTQSASGLLAGSYEVTVTDNNGCTASIIIGVNNVGGPSVSIDYQTNVLCNGGNTGSAALIYFGGTSPYNFIWSDGQTIQDAINLPAGTYTVTMTDASSCIATTSVTITEPALPLLANMSVTNISCFGNVDGVATSNPTGGTAPYTYAWSNSSTLQTISGLMAGIYNVVVTDDNGCTNSNGITVFEPSLLSVNVNTVNSNCGQSDGAAEAVPSGGTMPFTYNWSVAGGGNTLSNLSIGNYDVTLTDANGCTATNNFTISENSPLAVSFMTSTNVTCFGGSDGGITGMPLNGVSPYTYLWSNAETTPVLSGIVADTYTLTITDGAGCIAIDSIQITEPTQIIITGTVSDENAGSDGAIDLTVSGGTATFTYAWSNLSGLEDLTGLAAGTYTVTVTDGIGCTAIDSFVVNPACNILVDAGSDLTISASAGSVMLSGTVSGNTSTGIWTSDGTGTFSPSDTDLNAMYIFSPADTMAGSVTCTLTSTNNDICAVMADGVFITITSASTLTLSVSQTFGVSCFGLSDGAALVTANGGTTPYSYLWSNGSPNANAGTLTAGWYHVTVTDAAMNTVVDSVEITQPIALMLSTSSANPLCYGNTNGSASVIASGGTTPYSYNWSNGATTPDIYGIGDGGYSVTVTDSHGCFLTTSATLSQPPYLSLMTSSLTNESTSGACDGSLTVYASGGTGLYTYNWNPSVSSSDIGTALCAGTYDITVSDINACTATLNEIITSGSCTMYASFTSMVDATCYGMNNAQGSVTVVNGTAPFDYEWSNGYSEIDAAITTSTNTTLGSGVQYVTVTDGMGCTYTAGEGFGEPAELVVQLIDIFDESSLGACDGSISMSASGGTTPYTYLWSNASTESFVDMLCAESYTITVTDNNGCTATRTEIINSGGALPIVDFSANNTNITVGSSVAFTDNSTGSPTSWFWEFVGGTPSTSTSQNPTVVYNTAGIYDVTLVVSNIYGSDTLTKIGYIVVNNPGCAMSATFTSVNDLTCFGVNNGTATVNVANGTAPYDYEWSNGFNVLSSLNVNNTATGLAGGVIMVTITDDNGCAFTTGESIMEPAEIIIGTTSTNESFDGACDGTITTTVSGGTSPYSYLWSNAASANAIANLCAGTYMLTVTDNNACTSTHQGIIATGVVCAITTSVTSENVSCFNAVDGSISIIVMGGQSPYTYIWQNDSTTNQLSNISAGPYTVTITDAIGCQKTETIVITQPSLLAASITATPVSCFSGIDGSLSMNVFGGTSPYSYEWSTGDTSATIQDLSAGLYYVTLTDAGGCQTERSKTVSQPSQISASIVSSNVSCFGLSDGIATATLSGGTAPYSYNWSNGNTTSTATLLAAGSYSLTMTDANNCTYFGSTTIEEPTILESTILSTIPASCNGSNTGSATIFANGGTSPYTYIWDNGQIGTTANYLSAASHTVTITDDNSCELVKTVEITQSGTSVLSGVVQYSGGFIAKSDGFVTLYNANIQPYQEIAQIDIDTNGTFVFNNVISGNYVVNVKLYNHAYQTYQGVMQTYYNLTHKWQDALAISVSCETEEFILVEMVENPAANSGNGVVSGNINYALNGNKSIAGEPVPGAEVTLEQEPDDEPISNTPTDEVGGYEFTNVPTGLFSLRIDIPGIPQFSTHTIILTDDDPNHNNMDFIVDTNATSMGILTDSTTSAPIIISESLLINVYPNPADDYINIYYQSTDFERIEIEVINIEGKLVMSPIIVDNIEKENTININLKEAVPGTYFVKIQAKSTIYLKKIVVK